MKIKILFKCSILSFILIGLNITMANEVEVVDVKATQSSDKTWSFAVTLKHADEGWDHYANEWQVIAPDNKILATRTLYHPHVNEQPFTRGTRGVKIPDDIKSVRVIAKDTVHGLSAHAVELELSTNKVKKITLDLKKAK
jgi:hypothetical protein